MLPPASHLLNPRYLPLLGLMLVTVGMLLWGLPAWAQTEGPSVGLSKRLYCYVYTSFSSRFGLLFGLLLAFVGLLAIIRDQNLQRGATLFLAGALISSLTTIIESAYEGLASFMVQSGLANTQFTSLRSGFLSLGVGDDITQCDNIYVAPIPDPVQVAQQQKNLANNGSGTPVADTTALGSGNYTNGTPVNSCTPGKTCPLGIRNNNPGNLRPVPGHTYPGQIGVNKGFAVFDTMESGINQLNKQLGIYENKYGVNTLQGQINRYAPPFQNDTGSYVSAVVSYMRKNGYDVSANSRVNLSDTGWRDAYTRAIMYHENGVEVKK